MYSADGSVLRISGRKAFRNSSALRAHSATSLTAPPGAIADVRQAFEEELGVALTRVGRVEEGSGAVVVDARGEPMDLRAFQHWEDE